MLNKKDISEKVDFQTQKIPFVTFNDLCGHTLFNEKVASL